MAGKRRRRRSTSEEAEVVPATLGLDFGTKSSKLGLVTNRGGRCLEIDRIPASVPQSNSTTRSIFEFPAEAALDNKGKLVIGVQAEKHGDKFPLKTALLYCAGITRAETLRDLPGSDEFLSQLSLGRVTRADVTSAVLGHFQSLWDRAVEHAEAVGARITVVAVTYPNHLCHGEETADFDKYMRCYNDILAQVCPGVDVRFAVAEGQAAAVSMTEKFRDSLFPANRRRRRKYFEDLTQDHGLTLLTCDWGSSSLNLEVQWIYFDDDGYLQKSQSACAPGWLTGVRGGSAVTNSDILKVVKDDLGPMISQGSIPTSEVAEYLEDFERQKRELDYEECVSDGRLITLHGRGSRMVYIEPHRLRDAFAHAFDEGLRILEAALDSLLDLENDFAVLLLGGSVSNPGLQRKLNTLLEITASAAAERGITMKYEYLAHREAHPSSSVSIGAGLAAHRIPPPAGVLKGSAIALHRILRKREPHAVWTGENVASVMFKPGCKQYFDLEDDMRMHSTVEVKFALVCQHNYRNRPRKNQRFAPIRIRSAREVLRHRSMAPYELGWEVNGAEIPQGRILFDVSGEHIDRLADDEDDADLADQPIRITFSCRGVNAAGNDRFDRRDTKWSLLLRTDPATKLLVAQEVCRVPLWCVVCSRELTDQSYVCNNCDGWAVCRGCNSDSSAGQETEGHTAEHVTERVDLWPEDKCKQASWPMPGVY